jgi:hypothetical protein
MGMVETKKNGRLDDALGLVKGDIFHLKNHGTELLTDGSVHTHLIYRSTRFYFGDQYCYFTMLWGAPLKTRIVKLTVLQTSNLFKNGDVEPLTEAEFAKFILGLEREEV